MTHVTFMGTGGAFSAGSRGNLALLIESTGFRMVIEAGPLIMLQLATAGLEVTDVERIFVSHSHGDHTLGFPILALKRNAHFGKTMYVYGGSTTLAILRTLCDTSYPGLGLLDGNIRWHPLSEQDRNRTLLTENVTMTTDVMDHPAGVPTLAARWDFDGGPTVTFVTDTVPNQRSIDLAQGSDLLIHDSNYSAVLQPEATPAEACHSTARQAGEVARQAGCKRLALTHLGQQIGNSPDILIEEARAGTSLEVIVPDDGERILIR
jgi:ribonuclease Z